ncbi:hypothetical protein BC827DRAFT_1208807 [Russula dissimulans]|nr:hypothetical protein BC827DRAFT_1208807 [Russula dissimulans]
MRFVAVCNRTESNPYAPFDNYKEWELAKWLIKNMGQTQTEAFLSLQMVSAILSLKCIVCLTISARLIGLRSLHAFLQK